GLRVVGDSPLQLLKPSFGIEQRDTHRDLTEVRSAKKAEGRLLGVVLLVAACFCVDDDPLHVFEAAIEEIDALAADSQPRPAVDPRTPAVKVRDHRSARIVDGL